MLLKLCMLAVAAIIVFSIAVIAVKTAHFPYSRVKSFLLAKRRVRASAFVLTFLFTFAVFFGFHMNKNGFKQAIVSLNYTEASKAQNSNGTRFEMAEILDNAVIARAIEKGGFTDVTVRDLKKCLSVEPTVQGNSLSEAGYHISTEFRITYTANKNTAGLDAGNVVQLVGDAFKEFYISKYADDFSVMNFTAEKDDEAGRSDYLDIVTYLQKQSQIITNYMYGMADKNSSFVSSDGETFYSIASKVANLNTEQIENNIKAYITQNGISKDPAEYIERLAYKNTLLDYDAKRARSSFNTRNTAVGMYAEEMTRVVLVPTWDDAAEFYMGRTKVGIDELSVEAESYSKQSEEYYKQINTNNDLITRLSQSSAFGRNASLDRMIDEVESELEKYAACATRISQEYSETRMNNCISVSVTDNTFLKKAVVSAGLVLMFFFALYLYGIAGELLKNSNMTLILEDTEEVSEKGADA